MTIQDVQGFFVHHSVAIISSATGGLILNAVIRHFPTWPPSWEKLYNWCRDSCQEVASLKSGQPPPVQPSLTQVNVLTPPSSTTATNSHPPDGAALAIVNPTQPARPA